MSQFIPCIGHLSAGEIVKASCLSYDDFAGKKILDIGGLLSQADDIENKYKAKVTLVFRFEK